MSLFYKPGFVQLAIALSGTPYTALSRTMSLSPVSCQVQGRVKEGFLAQRQQSVSIPSAGVCSASVHREGAHRDVAEMVPVRSSVVVDQLDLSRIFVCKWEEEEKKRYVSMLSQGL